MALTDRKTYVVKERVGFMKLASVYDLLDADSGQPIGIAKEEPGDVIKYLRLLVNNRWLPTVVNVYESEGGQPVLSIHRGVSLFRPKVHVSAGGRQLGYFHEKRFTLAKTFLMYDNAGAQVGTVKGDWKGWNFQFLDGNGQELGKVTKKWAGLAKELFTTADTYVIALSDAGAGRPDVAQLLLAAGLAIDTVFKEKDE